MAKLSRESKLSSTPISSSQMMAGNRYFDHTSNVYFITPDWDKTTFPTVVKIVPDICEFNGKKQALPMRQSNQPSDYNQWFAPVPCATYVGTGDNKQSFILWDPSDPQYVVEDNPYWIMFDTLKRLSRDKEQNIQIMGKLVNTKALISLLPGSTSRDDVAFSDPQKKMTFMNVIPIMHRDKIQVNDNNILRGCHAGDRPYVMALAKSAAAAMLVALEPEDNAPADVTSLEGDNGQFMVVYHNRRFTADHLTPEGTQKRQVHIVDDMISAEAALAQDSSGSGNKREFPGFGVAFHKELILPQAGNDKRNARYGQTLVNRHMKEIISNYNYVGSYLHVPSHEEIVRYIAMAFRARPELVYLGLRDTNLITSEAKGILSNRTQAFVPGAVGAVDNSYDPYTPAADVRAPAAKTRQPEATRPAVADPFDTPDPVSDTGADSFSGDETDNFDDLAASLEAELAGKSKAGKASNVNKSRTKRPQTRTATDEDDGIPFGADDTE